MVFPVFGYLFGGHGGLKLAVGVFGGLERGHFAEEHAEGPFFAVLVVLVVGVEEE